jgi:hypothetical protein
MEEKKKKKTYDDIRPALIEAAVVNNRRDNRHARRHRTLATRMRIDGHEDERLRLVARIVVVALVHGLDIRLPKGGRDELVDGFLVAHLALVVLSAIAHEDLNLARLLFARPMVLDRVVAVALALPPADVANGGEDARDDDGQARLRVRLGDELVHGTVFIHGSRTDPNKHRVRQDHRRQHNVVDEANGQHGQLLCNDKAHFSSDATQSLEKEGVSKEGGGLQKRSKQNGKKTQKNMVSRRIGGKGRARVASIL